MINFSKLQANANKTRTMDPSTQGAPFSYAKAILFPFPPILSPRQRQQAHDAAQALASVPVYARPGWVAPVAAPAPVAPVAAQVAPVASAGKTDPVYAIIIAFLMLCIGLG